MATSQLDRSAWPNYGTNSNLGKAFQNLGVNITGVVLTSAPVLLGGVPPPPAPPPARPPPFFDNIDVNTTAVLSDAKSWLDDTRKLAALIGAVIGGFVLLLFCCLCCHFHKKDTRARCAPIRPPPFARVPSSSPPAKRSKREARSTHLLHGVRCACCAICL